MPNREQSISDRDFHTDTADAGHDGGAQPLTGRNVLVVEDEYLIAEDLAVIVKVAGGEVIGPADSLPKAMRLAREIERIDVALLNVDLQGVAVFPLADELMARGVPMLFLTGYDGGHIPDEYSHIRRCDKPTGGPRLVDELCALLRPVPA